MKLKIWLDEELKKPYMKKILDQIEKDETVFNIYPPKALRYRALEITPYENLKVVILGQDPYHQNGQANGLAFSCLKKPLPPSLKNIFKAIQFNGYDVDDTQGDLTRYAMQGVLLWNTYLSVIEGQPLSHQEDGYKKLTQALITKISLEKKHVVFLLWGTFSQQFESDIQGDHLIIKTSHPSPLSSYRGFLTSQQFKQTNDYLLKHHATQIDWR
jgi:uracil-DNA glycosylase